VLARLTTNESTNYKTCRHQPQILSFSPLSNKRRKKKIKNKNKGENRKEFIQRSKPILTLSMMWFNHPINSKSVWLMGPHWKQMKSSLVVLCDGEDEVGSETWPCTLRWAMRGWHDNGRECSTFPMLSDFECESSPRCSRTWTMIWLCSSSGLSKTSDNFLVGDNGGAVRVCKVANSASTFSTEMWTCQRVRLSVARWSNSGWSANTLKICWGHKQQIGEIQ